MGKAENLLAAALIARKDTSMPSYEVNCLVGLAVVDFVAVEFSSRVKSPRKNRPSPQGRSTMDSTLKEAYGVRTAYARSTHAFAKY